MDLETVAQIIITSFFIGIGSSLGNYFLMEHIIKRLGKVKNETGKA